ncbi:type II toxin-antitoxin system HicA family toxin [Paenibacillus polymyxa]|uniref:type II toxin-antitoxin system HicA family toxin n=1 Tax=Paenibacillus polymyxa TaxID=1406 RepID=UPI000F893AB7|nr:type II toxin-antitoxin system HicA family toxin [Paenibacillus polymyxa]QDA26482.1 addiction module toxin, HicA family [Paenibacillus polymyxa]RTZ30035.1 addiction module toxin, HicA family [Paenibacillus polymyxa]
MRSYSSREIKKIIEENYWFWVKTVGDHWQFKHPIIKGKITIVHPEKDVAIHILKDIEKKSGLKF